MSKAYHRLLSAGYLAADALASPLLGRRPHILIACMPKSASTFLATALAEVPGLRRCRLIPTGGGREQELCPIRLSRYNHCRYIAQHHVRYSEWTMRLVEQYRLTPVVIVRDLADIVVSMRDQARREPQGRGPTAFFHASHHALADEPFEEAIVRFAMPWYFNFYAGWRSVPEVPVYDYAQYTHDPKPVMADILKRAGHRANEADIDAALERINKQGVAQYNVGRSGRGAELSRGAKDLLKQMLDSYPDLRDDPLFIKTRQTLG